MAEPREQYIYPEQDIEVLRELIQRGIDSGPAEPLDWDDFLREANEELKKLQDAE